MESSRSSSVIARRRWALVADDLAGACDAAATFAQVGFSATVALDIGSLACCEADLFAYSTETRNVQASVARRDVAWACDRIASSSRLILFKKIDSVLRGSPFAETDQVLKKLEGARAVLTPALPAQGRFVVDRHLLVEDPSTGLPTGPPIEIPAEAGIQLTDASSPGDLRRIVADGLDEVEAPLFVGSAGLAAAVAVELASRFLTETSRPVVESSPHPALLILGTKHPVTESQIRVLKGAAKVIERTLDGIPRDSKGHPVLVRLSWDPPPQRNWLSSCLNNFGALVLSGGDTARYVLEALGAKGIVLGGELEPGVPWGRIVGGVADGRSIVTKSGGFGAKDLLLRILEAVGPRALKQ